MAQERILISSDWGKVTAELVDNNATRSLVQMLPLTIEMRDHLRQEKTGNLPSPLPAVERQLDFSSGTNNSGCSGQRRWPDEAQGQGLEVLHDGREVELVAGT